MSDLNDYDINTLCQISGDLQAIAMKHNCNPEIVEKVRTTMAALRELIPIDEYESNDERFFDKILGQRNNMEVEV